MSKKYIPELGRIPAYVSRYWRIPKAVATCAVCGQSFYHIIPHVMECYKTLENILDEYADYSDGQPSKNFLNSHIDCYPQYEEELRGFTLTLYNGD